MDTKVSAELKKVTLMLPADLLERAMKASGKGLTPTVREGLEAIAASRVFEGLLALRGKVSFPEHFLEDSRRD